MGLRIVPVQLFIASLYFVAIPIKHSGQAMVDKSLTHNDMEIAVEKQFPDDARQRRAKANKRQC